MADEIFFPRSYQNFVVYAKHTDYRQPVELSRRYSHGFPTEVLTDRVEYVRKSQEENTCEKSIVRRAEKQEHDNQV